MRIKLATLRKLIREEVAHALAEEAAPVNWELLGRALVEKAAGYDGVQTAKTPGIDIFKFKDGSQITNAPKKSDGKRRVTILASDANKAAGKIFASLSKEFGVESTTSGGYTTMEEDAVVVGSDTNWR